MSKIEAIIRAAFDWSLPFRALWRKFPVGSFELRSKFDAFPRPAHAYGMLRAVREAKALGISGITAIEFGVANGEGFFAMERMAKQLKKEYGVHVEVVGFDSGAGLLKPTDYRDVPSYWREGDFPLNPKLRGRSDIRIGDVKDTVPKFIEDTKFRKEVSAYARVPQIGFVAFDLDAYTPTVHALKVLDQMETLPRVYCYFDDVVSDVMPFNRHVGELLAIDEWNETHQNAKLAQINGLYATRYFRSRWPESLYVCHQFDHPRYNDDITRA